MLAEVIITVVEFCHDPVQYSYLIAARYFPYSDIIGIIAASASV